MRASIKMTSWENSEQAMTRKNTSSQFKVINWGNLVNKHMLAGALKFKGPMGPNTPHIQGPGVPGALDL